MIIDPATIEIGGHLIIDPANVTETTENGFFNGLMQIEMSHEP